MAADRPVQSEGIEITPEMIEAGASVLYGFETIFSDEELWARKVFESMARAHPRGIYTKGARALGKLE